MFNRAHQKAFALNLLTQRLFQFILNQVYNCVEELGRIDSLWQSHQIASNKDFNLEQS
jgi:hypothetical protein